MKLFVGIDVSSEKLDVCFLDSDGVIHREASLSNCVLGAYDIKQNVLGMSTVYWTKF